VPVLLHAEHTVLHESIERFSIASRTGCSWGRVGRLGINGDGGEVEGLDCAGLAEGGLESKSVKVRLIDGLRLEPELKNDRGESGGVS